MYFELLLWSVFLNVVLSMAWFRRRAQLREARAMGFLTACVVHGDYYSQELIDTLTLLFETVPVVSPKCETVLSLMRMRTVPPEVDMKILLVDIVHTYDNF